MSYVIDLHFHTEDEPAVAFSGSTEQCNQFVENLGCNAVGLEVVANL